MTDVMTKGTIQRLSSAYEHVDDIDLFTGGISERPVVGGVVGPTFACILGQQFLNLRKGDRFWYENGGVDAKYPGGFTSPQLQEIRKSSLSRVICNGLDDVGAIQPYAFLADDDFSNPSAIPLISGPSAIHRTHSECLNPDTNEICSAFGTCEEMEDDADWCNCDYLDSDGNKVDMNSFNGKVTFGDWCQCNQWMCRQNPDDEMECSGRGYCNCDTHDPNTDTYCECNQGFFPWHSRRKMNLVCLTVSQFLYVVILYW